MGGAFVENMDPCQMMSVLQHWGYIVLPISDEINDVLQESFRQYEEFDSRPLSEKEVFSLTPDSIGENNGWHSAGGLSRYNQCREGIIFQASCPIWPMLSEGISAPPDSFSLIYEKFRNAIYDLAQSIMEQIAIALGLPDPALYFTSQGPLDIIAGSQFHVKKIVLDSREDVSSLRRTPEDGRYLTLRAHRDPSVISLVFHRRRASDEYGSGLQFKDPDQGTFANILADSELVSARPSCIVIAGSILELLTNGAIKAPLHRITSSEADLAVANRLATTFFFQPRLESLLVPFSSISVVDTEDANCNTNNDGFYSQTMRKMGAATTPITYEKWKAKAYGSYYKGK